MERSNGTRRPYRAPLLRKGPKLADVAAEPVQSPPLEH
jgi:hypothetical protein